MVMKLDNKLKACLKYCKEVRGDIIPLSMIRESYYDMTMDYSDTSNDLCCIEESELEDYYPELEKGKEDKIYSINGYTYYIYDLYKTTR